MGRKRKKGIVSRLLTSGLGCENTITLSGVNGTRPIINSLMPSVERLSLEKKKKKSTVKVIYDGMTDMLKNVFSFDGLDYDDDNYHNFSDEYDYTYDSFVERCSKGRKGKKKQKKALLFPDDLDETAYDIGTERKFIKFYNNINNEHDVIEFKNIKEFSDFCDKHDYYVSKTDADNLERWTTIHCCLFPLDNEYGVRSIVTDNSYGGLYWSVSDETMASESEMFN